MTKILAAYTGSSSIRPVVFVRTAAGQTFRVAGERHEGGDTESAVRLEQRRRQIHAEIV